ncbi:hypothetical protein GCM10009830_40810 [Glycomyces endophyticus]|uniref:WXG100 family type VII secretion target n=1 Tax=Glycomyces endophyticus TaxID=480996 RepID=A0ABP4TJK9_9ACTN
MGLYRLEELDSDIHDLAVKLYDMQALQQAAEAVHVLTPVTSLMNPFDSFWFKYETIRSEQGAVVSGNGYPELGTIPERCRTVVGLDPQPYIDAEAVFESAALNMSDLAGAPGNILTNIGNWYGDAAEAFEDYFSGYEPAQARQAELFAVAINACASLHTVILQVNEAVRAMIAAAHLQADQMIQKYKDTQKELDNAAITAVLSVGAAVLGGVAATGATAALTVTGSVAGGGSSLIQATFTLSQKHAELRAINPTEFVDTLAEAVSGIEDVIRSLDDELYAEIDAARSQWNMHQIAVPAPPGGDEVDTESFYHESSA